MKSQKLNFQDIFPQKYGDLNHTNHFNTVHLSDLNVAFTDGTFLPSCHFCLKRTSSVLTLAGRAHERPLSKLYKLKNVVKSDGELFGPLVKRGNVSYLSFTGCFPACRAGSKQ